MQVERDLLQILTKICSEWPLLQLILIDTTGGCSGSKSSRWQDALGASIIISSINNQQSTSQSSSSPSIITIKIFIFTLSPWQDAFFALFLQLSALQALFALLFNFSRDHIPRRHNRWCKLCELREYVCILNFVFCIFKAAQEMMQMMPTSRVFCAIQDKRGCEGISLL